MALLKKFSKGIFVLLVATSVTAYSRLEYQIKAAYLYNFARFVRWPEGNTPEDKIVIGIFGSSFFGDSLEAALESKNIQGRRIDVRPLQSVKDAEQTHIVFITRNAEEHLAQIITFLSGKPVLTVGETNRFIQYGGMINFTREKDTIRFVVNMDAVEKAGLQISSQMLQFARIVNADSRRD